jgi:hypothetical protein
MPSNRKLVLANPSFKGLLHMIRLYTEDIVSCRIRRLVIIFTREHLMCEATGVLIARLIGELGFVHDKSGPEFTQLTKDIPSGRPTFSLVQLPRDSVFRPVI